jgi:hypothetical protein
MVVFRVIERAPHEQHVLCNHVADQNMGIMTKRLGDRSKFPTKQYKHRWVYYKPRLRWEAVCEASDTIYTAAATDKDVIFRAGRTWK